MTTDTTDLPSTLPNMLRTSAAQFGAQAAIIDGPVQISYAELWVTDAAWPAFDEGQLDAALASYASRERRFGGLGKP